MLRLNGMLQRKWFLANTNKAHSMGVSELKQYIKPGSNQRQWLSANTSSGSPE